MILASVQTAADTAPMNGWLVLVLISACLIVAAVLWITPALRDVNRETSEPTGPRSLPSNAFACSTSTPCRQCRSDGRGRA